MFKEVDLGRGTELNNDSKNRSNKNTKDFKKENNNKERLYSDDKDDSYHHKTDFGKDKSREKDKIRKYNDSEMEYQENDRINRDDNYDNRGSKGKYAKKIFHLIRFKLNLVNI
jgi:hypothetical protein